jgi:hypothetical protein
MYNIIRNPIYLFVKQCLTFASYMSCIFIPLCYLLLVKLIVVLDINHPIHIDHKTNVNRVIVGHTNDGCGSPNEQIQFTTASFFI